MAAAGLVAVLGYYVMVSMPALRAQTAPLKWYPSNFAGWSELAQAVREERAAMPAGTRIVADNFKVGAELGFALDDPRIEVLEHPVNRDHGRAPQLRLWGLEASGAVDRGVEPVLLVVAASEVEYKHLLLRYHALCRRFGPLPPARIVDVDHGRTRFLLFALGARSAASPQDACTLPAMAWLDEPAPDARVDGRVALRGWAFKDGVGIDRVDITLDGEVVATARYGLERAHVAEYWAISTDPGHPAVGFEADFMLPAGLKGAHWIGLRLHGKDGSVEDWPEQRIVVGAGG
jgi:hypothetical protein